MLIAAEKANLNKPALSVLNYSNLRKLQQKITLLFDISLFF